MEVPPLPPIDPAAGRETVASGAAGPGAGALAAAAAVPTALTSQAEAALASTAAAADQVHIHPLDVVGALLILIAEVRADLSLPGDVPHIEFAAPPALSPPAPVPVAQLVEAAGAASNAVPAAPQMLVQMLLQAVPPIQTQPPAEWLAAAMQVEAVLVGALDKGVNAVTAWHDVAPSVVEAAHEARAMFAAATSEDPPNLLWLRPEWLGLAPVMQRYWRRRRYARRVPSDPDYSGRGWEGLVESEAREEDSPREKLAT
jgi:hypothetical protein